MDLFQEKLNNCNKCPFEDYDINWYDKKTGCGKLGAYVYPGSDHTVMIVGQNPSRRRSKGEHAMKGRQGDIFREVFGENHLVFTNIIQVSTPDNKVDYFSNEQIRHCFNHLLFEIEELKPKVVIVCSAFAKRRLKDLNLTDSLTKWNSKLFFINHPDYYLTYHRGDINEYKKQLIEIKTKCI